jgi:hypothetical protein
MERCIRGGAAEFGVLEKMGRKRNRQSITISSLRFESPTTALQTVYKIQRAYRKTLLF